MRLSVAMAVAWASISILSAAEPAQAVVRQSTNIPAQSLGTALQALAKQRAFQVVYLSDAVDAMKTEGASGELTPDEALKQLLSGTGLTYRYLDESTVTVYPADAPQAMNGSSGAQANVPYAASIGGTGVQDEKRSFWQRLRLAQNSENTDSQESQSSQSSSEKSDSSSDESEAPKALTEIVVTATKRAERLQDVPISITAITADDIDRRGLVSAKDYLRGIPGVSHVGEAYGQLIIIRGIETATVLNSNPGVATYFGETPTTTSAGKLAGGNVDIKLVDIDRVEVLRGPQGTTFGNSSMAGAVRAIPVAPKLQHFEGKVAAGYSAVSGTGGDNYNVQAVGNLPLIQDKLAIRATGYQYQDSGFYRNRAASDPAFQAAIAPFGAQAFAIDEDEVGSYYAIGGSITALFQASDDLRFTLSYLRQETELDGLASATSGTYEQSLLQVAPAHAVRGETGGASDADIDIANAMMEYNLGWGNLLATYSHTESGSIGSETQFGRREWPLSNLYDSDQRQHIGEIRLATQLDGAWDFLAGVYIEDQKDEALADNLWYGDPARNPFGAGTAIGIRWENSTLKQKAAFGEASWELLQGLTLTGGVRAYEYDRTLLLETSGPVYRGLRGDTETTASGENFRANLSYKPSDDALLYASWSEGFRFGTLSPGLPPGSCDVNNDGIVDGTNITVQSTRALQSDEVGSYELGSKFTLFDRRLTITADVFRMEWSGLPISVRVGSGTCALLAYSANAGEAVSEGLELQGGFQMTEAFRVDFGGSWIDARLTEDVPLQGFRSGDRLPGSPKVNANLGLQYGFAIAGYKSFVRADSIYVGPFYGSVLGERSPNSESGDYTKVDARARVEIRNLNVDLFVDNLTNEDAFTSRGGGNLGPLFGYRLRPRTIGLRLGYVF